MQSPKVSVCVITYNHELYIRDCLESILSQQTDFEFEVIVGDDCSTDNTSSIVDEIAANDARVGVLRPPRNIGVTQNLLTTHNAARGQYVAYLEGDDLARPGKLARQVAFLDRNPKVMLCGHRMGIVDEHGVPNGQSFPAHLRTTWSLGKIIRCGMPVQSSSVMYRAEARSLRSADFEIFDWYFFTDMLRYGLGGYLPEALGCYRVHSTSLVASLPRALMRSRMLDLYRRRFEELPHHRVDFFAYAAGEAWTALRQRRAITPELRRFLFDTFSPMAAPALVDKAIWMAQTHAVMGRGLPS